MVDKRVGVFAGRVLATSAASKLLFKKVFSLYGCDENLPNINDIVMSESSK